MTAESQRLSRGWLGRWRAPAAWRAYALRMSGLAMPSLDQPRWWALAIAAGALPLALGFALRTSAHQVASAVALFVLLLAAVRAERPGRGMGALGLGFATHSALAIALAAIDPERAAAVMPDGEAYWIAQRAWITSGVDPEYEPMTWVPAHLQLLAAIVVLSFVSFGLIALMQGMYEVDLMNCYVGNLLARSDAPAVSLALGWHPWSVLRGLCYVVLVYELASLSLERFTGVALSSAPARRARWGAALFFFAADGAAKLVIVEPVRAVLASHLLA